MNYTLALIFSVSLLISCNSQEDKKEKAQLKIGQSTEQAEPQTELEKSMERGAIIYKDFCNQCHRPTGKGIGRSFPPLAGSDYLMNKRTESIRGVKYGQQGEIVVNGKIYNGVMAPMGLSDQEVVDVMNYVMNSWGNEQDEIVTLEEVSSITKE